MPEYNRSLNWWCNHSLLSLVSSKFCRYDCPVPAKGACCCTVLCRLLDKTENIWIFDWPMREKYSMYDMSLEWRCNHSCFSLVRSYIWMYIQLSSDLQSTAHSLLNMILEDQTVLFHASFTQWELDTVFDLRRTRASSRNVGKISSYQVQLSRKRTFWFFFHAHRSNWEISILTIIDWQPDKDPNIYIFSNWWF